MPMPYPMRALTAFACLCLALTAFAQEAPATSPTAGSGAPPPAAPRAAPESVQAIGQAVEGAVKGIFGFLKSAVDTVLNPKATELKALVDAGKFEEAGAFWVAHRSDLARAESAAPLAAAIGKGLGESLARDAEPVMAALLKLQPTASAWPAIRADLAAAEALVRRTRAHPFLASEPAQMPPWVATAESQIAAVKARFRGSVVRAFTDYDHRASPPFFEAYPVDIDRQAQAALAVRGSPLWLAAMMGASETQARSLARAYGPHLQAPESRQMVAGTYASVVRRERRWDDELTLPRVVQMMRALEDAGLDASFAAQSVSVGVIRGLDPAGDGFRWQAATGMPAAMKAHELPIDGLAAWAAEVAKVRPRQLYLLIDPSRVIATGGLGAIRERAGRRQIGQRTEQNPAWNEARERVEEARRELATAESGDRSNQAQAQQLASQSRGSSFAALAAVMGSAGSSMLVSNARKELADAERNLAQTPRVIAQPVLQPYRSAIAEVALSRTRQPAVYLVDGARATYVALSWEEVARHNERLLFGVDPRDRDHDAAAARNVAAHASIRQFLEAPGHADPAEIWRRANADPPSEPRVAAPLAGLERRVRDDHARWAAGAARLREGSRAAVAQAEAQVLAIVQSQP